jgi:hypothetical protein
MPYDSGAVAADFAETAYCMERANNLRGYRVFRCMNKLIPDQTEMECLLDWCRSSHSSETDQHQ